MALNPWGLVESLYKFAQGKWCNSDYSLVILSAGYYEQTDLFVMIRGFTLIIWLLILLMIIMMSIFYYINSNLNRNGLDKKSITNSMLTVIAPLINQNLNVKFNILFSIWSLMCLVLSYCFTSNILYTIFHHELSCINSLNDLVDSRMSVVIPQDSWIVQSLRNGIVPDPYIKILNDTNRIINGDAHNDVSIFIYKSITI